MLKSDVYIHQELLASKQSPLCLFSTRKSCQEFNLEILSRLNTDTKDILCTDEVDETSGIFKWSQKATDEMKKLNTDARIPKKFNHDSTYYILSCVIMDHAISPALPRGPGPRGGTTTSRERLINIFMSVFVYIFTFIQKTSSKSKSSVLTDCSKLDSEIILSECRIVGALEGTRLELGVRLVTLQPYTYW